ncbi:hypothetical protein [Aquidulcibacter sp.]|uniref:hypothetical protein n=1 Tax=Aquidulcibacter sp. TaxID=2052990 RepID=UPI0025BD1202|nr:hypothetical protein [Aquidulcibacter sp.]MCA3695364.1 hypothetical protein [Aquidulcibacter sp.]
MDDETLEIVTFKTVPTVTPEAVLVAAQGMLPWLKTVPGFLSRHMARAEDDQWVDCVRWDSKANALAAADAIMTAPGAADFMSVIEPNSVVMRHYHVALTV